MTSNTMKNARPASARIIGLLGSMNFAITLLVAIAIASAIGTVLQQNQPYPDYTIKFGEFWFDFFRILGLYDLYSAVWFLLILGFLVLSTATCITRNTPSILRELRQFRENVQEKSLRAMKNSTSFSSLKDTQSIQNITQKALKGSGYKVRYKDHGAHHVIAAMKGGANKWGYWLTHIGIIVICLGGLMDSRLPLMIAEWQGNIKPETRNIPASQVPEISQLSKSSFSYRGSVDIPEGRTANIIFLPVRDGYLVQPLPFDVEVKEFRVEHYSTGQPKSFESDIIVHDDDLEKPLETTISVNHPLIYKGAAIYQASFGDGGSEIKLKLHPFNPQYASQELDTKIFENYKLTNQDTEYKIEMADFRLFNINPIKNEAGEEEQKNLGPSVTFRLRNAAGEAIEYSNYMNPVAVKGRNYFVSGVKLRADEPQRFLHIPVDDKGSINLFMAYLRNLQDADFVRKSATNTTNESMQGANISNEKIEQQVVESMVRLTRVFATGGFDAIADNIAERFPEEQRENVTEAFMKVLNASLRSVYLDTLKQTRNITTPTEENWLFFDDSLSAIANLPFYGSPWFVQMGTFKQIEASGLQITKSPGKDIVYLGSLMLTIGVFLLFYVAHRRVWIWIKPNNDGSNEVIVAGRANRHVKDFEQYLQRLQTAFRQTLSSRGE